MKKYFKKIGDLGINPIGIGTWMMGGDYDYMNNLPTAVYSNDQREIDAIGFSIENGQNHIDTAWMYGDGHTEELVGEAIKSFDRSRLFIADKIWRSHMTKDAIIPSVQKMLQRLQTDYLDLLYVHTPKTPVPMEEYIAGINEVVELGLVRHLGISNFNLEQMQKAVSLSKHPIVANQMHFNVIYKKEVSADFEKYCKDNNILIVAYRPIERKLLADATTNETVLKLATKFNRTPGQIALNWIIQKNNFLAIPKSSKEEHILENLGALEFEMEEEDYNALNSLKDEIE